MKMKWQIGLLAVLMLWGPSVLWAQRYDVSNIEVDVVDDRGRKLSEYPLRSAGGPAVYKADLEARRSRN